MDPDRENKPNRWFEHHVVDKLQCIDQKLLNLQVDVALLKDSNKRRSTMVKAVWGLFVGCLLIGFSWALQR